MLDRLAFIILSFWVQTAASDIATTKPKRQNEYSVKVEASAFAKSNLHVWAYEEYDAVKRTPEEGARLLKELGITKAGYICRNAARVAEFEAYVQAYKKEGIELIALWTPVHTDKPLEEPQLRVFLGGRKGDSSSESGRIAFNPEGDRGPLRLILILSPS